MKLSSYINEAQVDVMSMEEFNEVMDELGALVEANTAQNRLVSLEALNADTNSAQYKLAMETILIPVGLGDDMSITAESLKEKIADVANRIWAKILRITRAIGSRFKKMYQGLKAMVVKHPPEMTFLRSWKKVIKKNSPDTAEAVIKKLEEKLVPIIHTPHHNAYTDDKVARRLLQGDTSANLAFTFLKITVDGENKSKPNVSEGAVTPHKLPAIIEHLSEVCEAGGNWAESLEEIDDKSGADDAAIKRFQAAVVAITADAALVRKAQTDVTPIYTAFADAAKKYGDKETENTAED